MSDPEAAKTAAEQFQKRAVGVSLLVGAVISAVYAGQASGWAKFGSIFAVAVMISAAALLAGGFFGFLFGIPRALQQQGAGEAELAAKDASQPDDGQQGVRYQANTNLEQISDWLTKILVGVGLTQLGSIPGAIGNYANATAPALGDFAGGTVFSVGLLLYYLVVGFIVGYLLTRLYLPGAFRQADLLSQVVKKVDELEKQQQIDAQALGLARRQLDGAQTVSEKDLEEALGKASARQKAQIFYDARALRRDNAEKDKPKVERTIPIFKALIASDSEKKFHQNYVQLAYALRDKEDPDFQGAVDALSEAIELRGAGSGTFPNYELTRACCLVRLDPALDGEEPSDEGMRTAIVADLTVAKKLVKDRTASDEILASWLKVNKLDPETLQATGVAEESPVAATSQERSSKTKKGPGNDAGAPRK